MSRLDRFIRRMNAQRDILNHIAGELALPDGVIYEVGLGNGRTYSHLREHFPGRRILVFDRHMSAHRSEAPPEEDLVLGEIRETAPTHAGADAALVHADIGTGYAEKDAAIADWLAPIVAGLMGHGAYAVSGLPLVHPELEAQPRLATVPEGAYYYYRKP